MAGVLVVTGGSRGIGAAVARQAAARGYGVCINYNRSRDAAEQIAGEIVANGGRAIAVRADTADEGDVVRLFDEVDRQLGTITALVNNAGILDRRARVEELTAERINRILASDQEARADATDTAEAAQTTEKADVPLDGLVAGAGLSLDA